MAESDERMGARVRRAATGVLLALIALAALAAFLGFFVGIAMLRLASHPAASAHPEPEPKASAPLSVAKGQPHDVRPATLPSRARAASEDPPKPPPAPAPRAAASLVRVDEHSAGGWVGRYGRRGYAVAQPGEPKDLPGGVRMSVDRGQLYIWSALTTDRRALSVPPDPARLSAGQWFAWENFSLDLDLRQRGEPMQVGLYLLDWDSDARAQRLEVSDADTGSVLLTRTDDHFRQGRYLLLKLSGHVRLRFTKTAGANCTLSGVFFDDPPTDPQ